MSRPMVSAEANEAVTSSDQHMNGLSERSSLTMNENYLSSPRGTG